MLSRRSFLSLAGGLAGSAVLLAACGSDDDSSSGSGTTSGGHEHDEGALTDISPAVVSSDLYVSPTPQRFGFVLLAKQGYASQGAAKVALAPNGTKPTHLVDTTLYEAGLPARRGVYVTQATFDKEGIWDGVVERDGDRLPFAFSVKPKPDAPTIGAAAITAPSPTTADGLGVNPICTRDPMCDLHEISLDTIIGKGKPVAVLFATPARCQTQYCGPVLDSLLPLVPKYQDRMSIVHVDIYKNLRTNDTSPTVTAWNLPSEPWLFGVDPSGQIVNRLDGAFGQDEMRQVLDQLVA
jgi:hypothetical protein